MADAVLESLENVFQACSVHARTSDFHTVDFVVLLLHQALSNLLDLLNNDDTGIGSNILRELYTCVRHLLLHWESKLIEMMNPRASPGRPRKQINIEMVSACRNTWTQKET